MDESPSPGEAPEDLGARLARSKAHAVADDDLPASTLVLAADTLVVLGDEALGKPRDAEENRAFLRRLSGAEHRVLTAHHLRRGSDRVDRLVETRVFMGRLDDEAIARYVASGEGLDKAGGYAIQGRGGALVPRIEGCWTNVVGLSLPAVVEAASSLGVELV